MSRDDFVTGSMVLVAFAFVILMGAMFGYGYSEGKIRTSAIEAGVARYTVNEKTGETKFEWIKPEGVGE